MRYIFADCVLDTELATLHRAGLAIPLRPKAFHLLQYLLEQREHLVAKDALCAQVWPAQFISDATLEGCLKLARQAVGDSGHAQRLIQTRRGYGYRFVGVVEVQPAVHADGASETSRAALAPPVVSLSEHALGRPEPVLPLEEPVGSLAGVGEVAPRRPAAGAADGERKLVTLLSCTLAHAPARRDQPGLDALHSQMRVLYALARSEVQQYGGTLQPVAGDRFMALFGVPVAQEDHARRAVLAALGLLQRVAAQRATLGALPGATLAVRMGLHTGLVAVGGMGDEVEAAAVVGDPATVATALQEHAAPGTLLCSDTTARLVQTVVDVEAVGPVPVGGQSTPVMAYKVLGRHPQRTTVAPHEARPWSRFVGRSRELVTLLALLARVEDGQGHVVGLMGDPGIGKSRLLDEFRQRLTARRLTYLRGRCLSYGSATPYLPVLDLLRHHCGLTDVDSPAVMTAKVHRRLQEVGMVPDEWAPYLVQLLGLEPGAEQLVSLSPPAVKARTFEALVQLSVHSSRQHLLVLEVEDLHWIDANSEEWLAALVERVAGVPILVLVSYRPGYRTLWMDKSYATQLTLQQLTPSDSRQVLRAVLHTEQVSAALEQAILAQAGGNPFFLEELARSVVEQGERPLTLSVPDTIQAVLAARIDRLPPAEKHLLQIAAVIGSEVPVPLLHAIAELPEEALSRGLTHLQATEFLYETYRAQEQAYTFKHALTQEVAYNSLLLERRRALHAGIVVALEALAGDRLAEQVERLAHHALRGEVWDKALAYCQQAGARADDRAAFREAVAAFEQALQALEHLPEPGDTRGGALEIHLALVYPLINLGEYGRGLAQLGEAEALARALDDRARLGRVLAGMAHVRRITGDPTGAIVADRQALALAAALGDSALQEEASLSLGMAYYAIGDFGRAAECLRRNVEAADWEASTPRRDMWIRSQAWLAWTLSALGAFAEGRHHGEEALRRATLEGRGDISITAHSRLGLLYLAQGDLEPAIRVLDQGLACCRASGERASFRAIVAGLGYAYALQGRLAEGHALLEEAISEGSRTGALLVYAYAWLSEVCRLVGRGEEAWQHARQALDLARQKQARGNEAFALLQLGAVHAHTAPPNAAQAEAHYQQALALADELGMRPLQAHCHLGLGTLYLKIGRREQSRTELSTAIALYRAMEMTFWLPQAEAALGAL